MVETKNRDYTWHQWRDHGEGGPTWPSGCVISLPRTHYFFICTCAMSKKKRELIVLNL